MARTTDNYTTHGTSTTETTKPETAAAPSPVTKPDDPQTTVPETKPEQTLDLKFTGAELREVLRLIPPVDNRTEDDPVKSAREKFVTALEKLDAAKPKETVTS